MKKKVLLKLVSALAAAAQILSCTALAAVIKGGGDGTESGFYLYEDFNDLTDSNIGSCFMKKSSSGAALARYEVESGNQAVKITTTAGGKMGYVTLGKLDFSKGPLVLSYDVISPSGTTITYGTLNYGSAGIALAYLPRFDNSYVIKGYSQKTPSDPYAEVGAPDNASYPNGLASSNSASKYAAGKSCTVQVYLDYDSDSEILTVKEFINGEPLVNSAGEQYGYKMKRADMAAAMGSSMVLRFNMGSGKTAVIDNIMLRTEGELSLPKIAWAGASTVGVSFLDSVVYKNDAGEEVSLTYTKSRNNLAVSDYVLKKYSLADDPLLMDGTVSSSKISWSAPTGVTISGIDFAAANNDFYVLKLTNPESVTNTFGRKAINGDYMVIQRSGLHTPQLRETLIFDKSGNQVSLDNGKLPTDIGKLEFRFEEGASISAEDVTFTGEGISAAAVAEGNAYVIDLSGYTLKEAHAYTVTAGDASQSLMTTGTSPYAFAYIDRIDTADAVSKYDNGDPADITLSYSDGKLKYENKKTTGTANVTLDLGMPFDFSKGAMLVSFDAEANQSLPWLGSGSHLILPEVLAGSKSVGMLPALEHGGIYGITLSSAGGYVRNTGTAVGAAAMKPGTSYTLRALLKYYPEKQAIGVTQFKGDEILLDRDGAPLPEYFISVTEEDLQGNIKFRLAGRNFADGGMLFDNISVTTIDKITASSLIKTVGGTATPEIKSSVVFEDGTDAELTKAKYISTVDKSGIIVNAYEPSDVLLASPTPVSDFNFDKDTFTISGLDDSKVYTIELEPGSVKSFTGESLATCCFKAAASPAGLIKTSIYDINGETMTADSNGLWPANAAKISFMFPEGYVTGGVSIGELQATEKDGEYSFDLSAQPLSAGTEYPVTVNGSVYGTFTTGSGAFTVAIPVINNDNTASVTVSNTEASPKTMYIISASFDAQDNLIDLTYKIETVQPGTTGNYSIGVPDITGASKLKVFVWNSFKTLEPYCAPAEKTLN
ncbi:MAG: hypothetical protein J6N52_07440 [Clostridia bacterium]|nr:hypothetical protein [Clostridia bacterium]